MVRYNIKLKGVNKMKRLLRGALGRFKSVKINLLDGQKRGEIIFRRAFFLIVMFVIVALLGMLLVEKEPYEEHIKEVEEVEAEEGIDGAGNVVREGDIVNGQEVVVEDGKAAYIVDYQPKSDQVKKVESFVFDTYEGAYTQEYFNLLVENCSGEGLRTVIALSVAESSMGKNTSKKSNWYGWFKGGNRSYDPSQEEMAKEICTGVEDHYLGITTDMSKARKYVGYVSESWLNNIRWAYAQMGVK